MGFERTVCISDPQMKLPLKDYDYFDFSDGICKISDQVTLNCSDQPEESGLEI